MKKLLPVLTACVAVSLSSNLFAMTVEERLEAMERRIGNLEQRIEQQDKEIAVKDQQIRALEQPADSSDATGWFNQVEVGGVVEVEAQRVSPDNAADTSDIYVATVELGIAAEVNEWTNAEIVLLYEDDGTHSGELLVDTAIIHIADPDANWFMTAGKYALPFGHYATNLVSDPITLDMAETADAAVEFGVANQGFNASLYVFKGDQETEIKNYGANVGYMTEQDDFAFTGGLGWINDLAESDSVVDDATAMTNKASAWTAFAQLDVGAFSLIGEYVAAVDSLDVYSTSDKPSAFNIEAAYGFDTLGKPAMIAVGYQGTDEASLYAGGLDEERILAAFSIEVMSGTNLAFEYQNAEDYSGVETDTVTGQLAVEF